MTFIKKEYVSMRLYTYSIKIIFLVLCISGQEMGQVGIQRGARKDNRGLEIGGSYGYQYGGAFTVYDGDANIIDTKNYGFYLVIPLPIGRGKQLEINYSRQDTRLELTTYNTEGLPVMKDQIITDLLVEYYQVGGIIQFLTPGKRFIPYAMLTLGTVRYHPKNSDYTEDRWLFAAAFAGGIKIFFREKIGLRFQTRMLLPINWGGSSFWFGSKGPPLGISGGSTILQGDLSAGLFFVL